MSTPQSTITMCTGVRLTNRYTHTIYFSSASAQQSWFAGKMDRRFSAYTYVRQSWSIKVGTTMSEAQNWSYCYFDNGGKTYYYFVNRVEYVNDNTVEVFIEMDVMQTYMFDYDLLPCFVEREHCTDDTPGSNTVDEGLDPGEYRSYTRKHLTDLNELSIMILASANPQETADGDGEIVPDFARNYDGVFSGLSIYAMDMQYFGRLGTILNKLDEKGATDIIHTIWMYPTKLLTTSGSDDVKDVTSTQTYKYTHTAPSTLGGYSPRNKKLLTYPYRYLYVTNNNGESNIYHYERFSANYEFYVHGGISPEAGIRIVPATYDGSNDFSEGVNLGNYPTCAWQSDTYKLWLAQNQNQHGMANAQAALKLTAGLIVTAVGAGVAGPIGAAAGGATAATMNTAMMATGATLAYNSASEITNHLAMKRDRALEPPTAKGIYSASVAIKAKRHTFTVMDKGISQEYAKRLDEYFDMYGYKTSRVKIPNRSTRPRWNYVKTIGCAITPYCPAAAAAQIEAIYDNGITFWKDGDKIGQYNLDNSLT